MIQLRILGSPSLEDGNGGKARLLLSQPKRLALLAYLATTTNGTLARRETVLALFWPDEPDDKARHALNQALHVLRRYLGPGAVVTKGEGIGVDPRHLWCDAAAFLDALKRGDRHAALGLYGGKLLEGFFAGESGGFERWVDELRDELHGRAAAAASAAAEAAASREDPSALDWARRACELAPYDESAARRLMLLLDHGGDRAGALEAYQRYAARLHFDLELEPSPEIRAYADAIRAAAHSNGSAPVVAEPAATAASPAAPSERPARVSRFLLLGTGALLLAGLGWSLRGRSGAGAEPASLPVPVGAVAVLPFEVSGDSAAAARSAREVVELLGARLHGMGRLRAVAADSVLRLAATLPRRDASERSRFAERLGAGSYVEGGLTVAGGRLHLRASWRRSDNREIAAATAEGELGSLFEVLDSLVVRFVVNSHPGPRDRLTRIAALTSPSLAALKAYLDGEAAFGEGRFDAAARAFERAASDSSFALAQYRFGLAALWTSDYPLAAQDAGARALRHAGALPNRERRLLEAFDAWRTGNAYVAEHGPRNLIAVDRDDLEAWFAFGEARFHYNPVLGREAGEAREAFERVLRLDPKHWLAHWHLALLAALDGRLPDLDRHVATLERLGPQTDYRPELAALQSCAHRDAARLPRVLDSLRALGQGRLTDIVWRCAVYGRNLAAAEAIARLLLVKEGLAYAEQTGREHLATLAMARGRYRDALAQLDSFEVAAPGSALADRTLFATLPLASRPSADLIRLRDDWQSWAARGSGWWATPAAHILRHHLEGLLSAELGRSDDALRHAAELERLAHYSSEPDLVQTHAAWIRGDLLARTGRAAEALQNYESVYPITWFGLRVSALVSDGLGRFRRAGALEQVGRHDDALGWYAGLGQFSTFDLIYAPLAHFQRGKLLEQRNNTGAAIEAYSRFIEMWETADPEYQPLVREARQRLDALR